MREFFYFFSRFGREVEVEVFPRRDGNRKKNSLFFLPSFFSPKQTGHTGQRGIGGDGNKFDTVRAALLAAAEADAEAARARLEAAEAEAEAEAKSTKTKHGRQEVAAASAAASPSSAQRIKQLRRAAERAAADARFPDLPPPPPVAAFDSITLSLVGDLLSDGVLGSLAGVGGGGALLKFNSTTRKSGSGWSNGGIGALAVPGPALPAMEALGQASGFVLYRASIPRAALSGAPAPVSASASSSSASASAPPHHASAVLDLGTTVHDYGGVYLDGTPVAALDRASFSTAVALPRLPSPALSLSSSTDKKSKADGGGNVTLDILVHEMGRVNFGCVTLDHKGLETDAVTLDGKPFFFFSICESVSAREREREERESGVPFPLPFPSNRDSKSNHSRDGRFLFFCLRSVTFVLSFYNSGESGEKEREDERETETETERPWHPFSLSLPLSPKQPPQKTLLLLRLLLLLRCPQPRNQRLERRVAPQRPQVLISGRTPAVVEAGLPDRGAQGVQSSPLVPKRGVGAGSVVKGGGALAVGQRRGLVPELLVS